MRLPAQRIPHELRSPGRANQPRAAILANRLDHHCHSCGGYGCITGGGGVMKNQQDLYTSQERVQNSPESVHIAQPGREPLTDDQIQEIYISEYNKGHHGRDFENLFARGIERAHHIGISK
jgi:hypothetical protein